MPAREGSLGAPTRHSLDWTSPEFYDEEDLFKELERVFDICHGCRRCVSLCQSFPELFDLVDESTTMEVDGIPKADYWKVVDHCYLCDLCFMTKCPYVPPHDWNLDYPHLMLRAKAVKFKQGKTQPRDKILSSTDAVGAIASLPVVDKVVNATNKSALGRKVLEVVLGVHRDARIPEYHNNTLRKQLVGKVGRRADGEEAGSTTGKVALFTTCYNNVNEPDVGMDLVTVFEHNGIPITIPNKERCCGMPKLELGDLESVKAHMEENIPVLMKLVDEGWDIVAPIPSCVLMFKQELPLLYPDDPQVQKVKAAMFDPFEYLMLRHKAGLLRTDFARPLGKVSYHVPCHLRVQNLGLKTRDVLKLVPGTEIEAIERCSGHNGTYGVKREYRETSMKIGKPVFNKVQQASPDYYASDCPMAGHQIESGLKEPSVPPTHPLKLLRLAYGI